ncbi:MAG: hypothetical protein MJ212_03920 [Alphaproteobacteria bacterium]|nr:hypothetical protein [Alphaproteobacteria bacterium]
MKSIRSNANKNNAVHEKPRCFIDSENLKPNQTILNMVSITSNSSAYFSPPSEQRTTPLHLFYACYFTFILIQHPNMQSNTPIKESGNRVFSIIVTVVGTFV